MARIFVRFAYSLCKQNVAPLAWNILKGSNFRSIARTEKMSSITKAANPSSSVTNENVDLELKVTLPHFKDESDPIEPSLISIDQLKTVGAESTEPHLVNNDQLKSGEFTMNESEVPSGTTEAARRIRLRKVILLLSYSGQGYFGMQKNPGTKTIEEDLLQALLKSNYIEKEYYNRPQLIHFQRAARTDKNVSAARQIVSVKLPDNLEISKVNECLPPTIRIMGVKRVTKAFDAKGHCDARTYSYMMPTFAFVPVQEKTTEDYRITADVLTEVRETLKLYLGTKNHHNFTSRKHANDPSAKRFIMEFTCSDPFIQDGLEYVILRVKGQSFMMHQIRKMIGLLVAMLRGFANTETMEKVWTNEKIDIPRAPGVGLMLDQVHYERYDKRFGKDGVHETLTWENLDKEIAEFCKVHVYQVVTDTENNEKSMLNWLSTLSYHTYDVREVNLQDELQPAVFSKIGKAHLRAGNKYKITSEGDDEDEEGRDDDDSNSNNNSVSVAKRQKLSSAN